MLKLVFCGNLSLDKSIHLEWLPARDYFLQTPTKKTLWKLGDLFQATNHQLIHKQASISWTHLHGSRSSFYFSNPGTPFKDILGFSSTRLPVLGAQFLPLRWFTIISKATACNSEQDWQMRSFYNSALKAQENRADSPWR